MGISAANTANNLLYLLTSFLLGFMGISGFFGKRNLSKIEINIDFPEEIHAGQEIPVRLRIRNIKRFFPSLLLRIEIEDRTTFIPFLDPGEEVSLFLHLLFPKRGRKRIRTIFLSSSFPFNFFRRIRKIKLEKEIIVFPGIKSYRGFEYIESHEAIGGRKNFLKKKEGEEDIISIRDYIEKDGLKYIHWKASAKTDALKTKELSGNLYKPVIIDFEKIYISDLEEKISSITYAILNFTKNFIPVGLKIGKKFFEPALSREHKLKLLKELALYGTDRDNP